MTDTTTKTIQNAVQRTLSRQEIPVRLAVYTLDGDFLAYKADSCWSLDKRRGKVHDLSQSGKEGNLARNLLFAFREDKNDEFNEETFKGTWFRRFPQGVKVVVEDLREDTF